MGMQQMGIPYEQSFSDTVNLLSVRHACLQEVVKDSSFWFSDDSILNLVWHHIQHIYNSTQATAITMASVSGSRAQCSVALTWEPF